MEEIIKAFTEYSDKLLRLEELGFVTSTEISGSISGYIHALTDLKLIDDTQKTELYKMFYEKFLK